MHVRRALLLFAIVLGLAALVASVSRTPAERKGRTTTTQAPEAGPGLAEPPADNAPRPIAFDAAARDRRRLAEGRAATLEVAVDEPGSVEIPDMGLTASADERTPARFEIFAARTGAYAILFRPAGSDDVRPAGRLVVTAEG